VFAGTGGSLTMLSAVRGTIDNINETTGTDIPDVAFRATVDLQHGDEQSVVREHVLVPHQPGEWFHSIRDRSEVRLPEEKPASESLFEQGGRLSCS
jgi:hypothetical protein